MSFYCTYFFVTYIYSRIKASTLRALSACLRVWMIVRIWPRAKTVLKDFSHRGSATRLAFHTLYGTEQQWRVTTTPKWHAATISLRSMRLCKSMPLCLSVHVPPCLRLTARLPACTHMCMCFCMAAWPYSTATPAHAQPNPHPAKHPPASAQGGVSGGGSIAALGAAAPDRPPPLRL